MTDRMRTVTGLTVPTGYGGDGSVVLKGAKRPPGGRGTRSAPPRERRHVNAEDVQPGTKVLGHRGGVYEVLSATDRGTGYWDVLVMAPSGAVRTWTRRATFGLELA